MFAPSCIHRATISLHSMCVFFSHFYFAFIYTLPQDNNVLVNAFLYQCKVCNVYRSHEWFACWRYFRSFSRFSSLKPVLHKRIAVWQWFRARCALAFFFLVCAMHWKYQTNCATFYLNLCMYFTSNRILFDVSIYFLHGKIHHQI